MAHENAIDADRILERAEVARRISRFIDRLNGSFDDRVAGGGGREQRREIELEAGRRIPQIAFASMPGPSA